MRIVHAISSLAPNQGGTVTAAMAMVRGQRLFGHELVVVTTCRRIGEAEPSFRHLREWGAEVHEVGPGIGPTAWHPSLAGVLRRTIDGADVLHIHALWEEIQHRAARIAQQLRVPYVVTTHGMLDPWSLGQRALKKRLYLMLRLRRNLNRAGALHFTTEIERDLAARLKLRSPTFVEPYSIDFSEFEQLPPPGWLRQRVPQIGGRKVVLFFGRLHYKKGLGLLIDAFAGAIRDDAVLVLAGPVDADYEAQVDQTIARHGIADRVFKTGMLHGRERVSALADADLFVLPSYQENFGIAVVEALASGTPVIISDQVNIHPTIARGRVGAVVPTQVEPLREQIVRWLDDASLRADAASRAREFVFEEYELSRSAKRWIDHYERIITAARAKEKGDMDLPTFGGRS